MSLSFFESTHRMLPGIWVTTRSTLVSTPRGSVLISPIELTPQSLSEIRAHGEVVAIVEPNKFHNLWAKEAKTQFPRAELWCVPGFDERHKDHHPDKILTRDPWPFEAELALQMLEGAEKINEAVLLHRATRTLIVTDLIFNMKRPQGFLTPIMFRLMGSYRKFAVSSMWKRMVGDRAAFKASLEKILAWEFDRLVMAHGSIVEGGGKAKLRAALEKAGWV